MSQDQKREAIIEAAIKRFAHFGVSKTTMTEIGNDLSISKALLYYYFPAKLNLYVAVVMHITSDAQKRIKALLDGESDPNKAILLYLDVRTDFIINYYNILEYLSVQRLDKMPPELHSLFSYSRENELKIIISILEKGIKQKILELKDTRGTAELFLDFLEGFRKLFLSADLNFFPDKKKFQVLLEKERAFAIIFFKGLSVINE